jgi:hypothetical protein
MGTKRTWRDVDASPLCTPKRTFANALDPRKKLGRGEVNLRALMIQHPK